MARKSKSCIAALLTIFLASMSQACARPAGDTVREKPIGKVEEHDKGQGSNKRVNTNGSDKKSDPDSKAIDGEGISGLPFARGKSFVTLDQYLRHLERNGTIGLPYYREVRLGVYAYITTFVPKPGNSEGNAMPLFTRQQLLDKFGFKE